MTQKTLKLQKFNYGFTLLEMVISIGIFSVLVVTAIGITLNVSNAQLRAADFQAVQDNIRFSLELMTKELRTGSLFNLSTYCSTPGNEINFEATSGHRIYYLDNGRGAIMRATETITNPNQCFGQFDSKFKPLTADEISVERLTFTVYGQNPGANDGQPWITVAMKVKSRDPKNLTGSPLNLQTTIVQRLRDL